MNYISGISVLEELHYKLYKLNQISGIRRSNSAVLEVYWSRKDSRDVYRYSIKWSISWSFGEVLN